MEDELAQELRDMAARDHDGAGDANSGDPAARLRWHRLTAEQGDRLAAIMDQWGWPTTELVGEEAAQAAWLIAQHADRQLSVQRRALELMSAAGSPVRQVAFLTDRVRVAEGRPQLYGTQIAGVADEQPVPWPCEEPERLDARRSGVGIEPFAAYVARHAPS